MSRYDPTVYLCHVWGAINDDVPLLIAELERAIPPEMLARGEDKQA